MIENLPFYVPAIFILTTFITVGIFLFATKKGAFTSLPTKTLSFLVPFWLFFQGVLSVGGFYLNVDSIPPRIMILGVLPSFLVIILLFLFARKSLVERMPLKTLTIIHFIRIPVELVLFWLFQFSLIPQLMTFEGRNFDILAGLTAPLIYWLAFRQAKPNRLLLIIWNIFSLILLINIVVNAVFSFQTPFQQFGFEQPNQGLLYFPFIWLPSVIVPIILFSHLASFWQLLKSGPKP